MPLTARWTRTALRCAPVPQDLLDSINEAGSFIRAIYATYGFGESMDPFFHAQIARVAGALQSASVLRLSILNHYTAALGDDFADQLAALDEVIARGTPNLRTRSWTLSLAGSSAAITPSGGTRFPCRNCECADCHETTLVPSLAQVHFSRQRQLQSVQACGMGSGLSFISLRFVDGAGDAATQSIGTGTRAYPLSCQSRDGQQAVHTLRAFDSADGVTGLYVAWGSGAVLRAGNVNDVVAVDEALEPWQQIIGMEGSSWRESAFPRRPFMALAFVVAELTVAQWVDVRLPP